VVADGGAAKPDEYASSVLGRIAWLSQRHFAYSSEAASRSRVEVDSLQASEASPSAIVADIEIRQLLETLDDRDRQIVTMRSRGWTYKEITRARGSDSAVPLSSSEGSIAKRSQSQEIMCCDSGQ